MVKFYLALSLAVKSGRDRLRRPSFLPTEIIISWRLEVRGWEVNFRVTSIAPPHTHTQINLPKYHYTKSKS